MDTANSPKDYGIEIGEVPAFAAIDHPNKRAFLAAYVVCGRVGKASEASGVLRRNHYYWLATDEAYRKAFHASRDRVADHIEDGLVERLACGWDEPVYQGGELVGHKRKYDNAAALRWLASANPKVFGNVEPDVADEFRPVDMDQLRRRMIAGEEISDFEASVAETIMAMRDSISTNKPCAENEAGTGPESGS